MGQLGAHAKDPDRSAERRAIPCTSSGCQHDDNMLVKSYEYYEMTRLITAGCRWVMMGADELTTIVNRIQTSVNMYEPRHFKGLLKQNCGVVAGQDSNEQWKGLSEIYQRRASRSCAGMSTSASSSKLPVGRTILSSRLPDYTSSQARLDFAAHVKKVFGIQLRTVAINCSLFKFQQEDARGVSYCNNA